MDKIKSTSKVEIAIKLSLTEDEARALGAIVCYGTKEFLKCFYEHLGRHYLEPYQEGVFSLFETIKTELPSHLNTIDKVREILNVKK